MIGNVTKLLSPYFHPIMIINHGVYHKEYDTKWRASFTSQLFTGQFPSDERLIFVDYGGNGASARRR